MRAVYLGIYYDVLDVGCVGVYDVVRSVQVFERGEGVWSWVLFWGECFDRGELLLLMHCGRWCRDGLCCFLSGIGTRVRFFFSRYVEQPFARIPHHGGGQHGKLS